MRGFIFSLDVMVAAGLIVLLSIMIGSVAITYRSPELEYQRLYYKGKDVLNTIDNIMIRDIIDIKIINDMYKNGSIVEEDLDKSFMDVIGSFWSQGNLSEASDLAEGLFGYMLNNSKVSYSVKLGNDTIYQKNSTSTQRIISRLFTTVSGFEVGKPVNGYVSRAYITKAQRMKYEYTYFGGYEGDGNLTKNMTLRNFNSVDEVFIEMDAGNNFTMYVNDLYCDDFFVSENSTFKADSWYAPDSCFINFHEGINTININFSSMESMFVGGGYIRVKYNTSYVFLDYNDTSSNKTRYYDFPGINGVINMYSSFYVDGDLDEMSVYLKYKSNYPIFFSIGNATILQKSDITNGTEEVFFNSTELIYLLGQSNLSYSLISNRTVPLRFGTDEVILEGFDQGKLDTVLMTDRTGSMTACDVDASCRPELCDTYSPCHDERSEVALDADRAFVDAILETSGNEVSLVGNGEKLSSVCSNMYFTGDNDTLNDRFDDYKYSGSWQGCGYTCISCGVVGSTRMLIERMVLDDAVLVSDKDSTVVHVGDSGPVEVNETLTVSFDDSKFIKSELSFLAVEEDVEDGYKDCVFLNGRHIGMVCKSNTAGDIGWHTCTYPLKKEWLNNGDNVVSITGANINGCTDTSGEQDDWDFKDVEISLWEVSQNTTSESITGASPAGREYEVNYNDQYNFSSLSHLWEVSADEPNPVDFTSGVNSSFQSFGLGGDAQDDGWDWQGGVYGYSGVVDFNGAVDGKIEFDIQTSPYSRNNCVNDDCDAAFGIQFNITQEMYESISNSSGIFVQFDYEWEGNPTNPFEDTDQVWIKGRFTEPSGTVHWLGSNLDGGVDATYEIATENNPDTEITGTYYGNVTQWVTGPGRYYLDFGGKVMANSNDEWGYFRFDDVEVGVGDEFKAKTGSFNFTFPLGNMSTARGAYITLEAYGIDPSYYNCVFVNGEYAGTIDYQRWYAGSEWGEAILGIPAKWLTGYADNYIEIFGGTQSGCTRTGSTEEWIFKDVKLSITQSDDEPVYDRVPSMLIMSDGEANTKIGDCRDYGSGSCPSIPGEETPSQQTVRKACEANERYNLTIYAVAFGNVGSTAIQTLNQTAGCDDYSHFYTSNDADELVNIYRLIARDMINLSFRAQAIKTALNISMNNTLYPESYISFKYTASEKPIKFGQLDLTMESKTLGEQTGEDGMTDNVTGTKEGWFFIPENTEVMDAKITSYSSQYWTDRLYVKGESNPSWSRAYWLGDYVKEYPDLGDPYTVRIPAGLLNVGENNSVKIGTGLAPENATGASPDNKVIYTLRFSGISYDGYSGVFPKAKGSTVNVYYDLDADNIYDGYSVIEVGSEPSDMFDPDNDSIDDAFSRILNGINFVFDADPSGFGEGTPASPFDGVNSSNPVDIQIASDLLFSSNFIFDVRSMWGPANVEIDIWS